MRKNKLNFRTIAYIVLLITLLTGCSYETTEPNNYVSEEGSVAETLYRLSDADLNTGSEDALNINFGDEKVYLITDAGTYLITGSQGGQICIDAEDGIVHLIMENASLKTFDGPAIYVRSAAKVVITVPDGTRSLISDSTNYKDYPEAEACIYSASDLTFNGKGQLQVTGYYKDAVRSKDTLKILDLDLKVQSKKDGLRGNDGVIIENANVDLQCEGNGIYTKEDSKEGKGFVSISDGAVSVIAGKYGIRSARDIYLNDSSVNVSGLLDDYYYMGNIFAIEE